MHRAPTAGVGGSHPRHKRGLWSRSRRRGGTNTGAPGRSPVHTGKQLCVAFVPKSANFRRKVQIMCRDKLKWNFYPVLVLCSAETLPVTHHQTGCSDPGNDPETANATSSAQPSAKTQVARLIPSQDLGLCALLTQSAGA